LQTVESVIPESSEDHVKSSSEQSGHFDTKLNIEISTDQVIKIIILYYSI